MSHFTAFFPSSETADPRVEQARVERAYREGLCEPSLSSHEADGAWILTSGRAALAPRMTRLDGGWVAIAGRPIDLDATDEGGFSSPRLFAALTRADDTAINRFEGLFAAVAWQALERRAWVLNDQTSNLNLYYIERPEGLWASTVALPLALALGVGLDAAGVREFFARGTLLTPRSLFAGIQRLDMGERLEYRAGQVRRSTHWTPFQSPRPQRNLAAAAEALSDLAIDRVKRLAAPGEPVISDLTGGYDSRLIVTAAAAAGRLSAVTVDGPHGHGDVEIAKRVAAELGWELEHFDTATFWSRPIDPAMRRELTYRLNGELAFTEIYHHLHARPLLAQRFGLHMTGGGGELMRSFPWSQEFFGIGKRRRANVENALAYRYFQEGPPTSGLFTSDWHPLVVDAFRRRLTELFDSEPDTLTTQQLDAAYLWRMTGFAPYTSSVAGWMNSVAPLMCAETVNLAIALPWKLRLTSQLVRTMIDRQLPRAAAVETRYGGTAGPTRVSNVHRQAWQLFKQGYHLFLKLDRVRLGGLFGRVLPAVATDPMVRKPYLTPEFREFLRPDSMMSRGLYRADGLKTLLQGDDGAWYDRERMILRVATIEQICRELDWEPSPQFLSSDP